jgi:autotransporter passenger strand-loop-strand repeat protein
MLAALAARSWFVQPAVAQYVCPSSCAGLTLNHATQTVNSGGTATSTTINLGQQTINSGGTASGTTINSGGQQGIFAGGVASATTVNSGGGQFVLGGAAVNTTINSAGFQEVDSGSVTSVTVNFGGTQVIFGGTVTSVTVDNAIQEIDGGAVTRTVISGGGVQHVDGGTADQTTVYDGLQLIDGGTATNTVLSDSSAEQDVFAGSAVNTTVNGGTQFVFSGGVTSATLVAGGIQNVSSGGLAVNTTVLGSGVQSVYAGGIASSTTLNNGGNQLVANGGQAISATVNSGGVQTVNSGGLAIGTAVNSGGAQTVTSGGIVSSTVVSAGGAQNIASGGVAIGTVVSSGGIQAVSSGGIAQPTAVRQGASVVNDGTVVFNSAGTSTFDGTLTGSGAVLQKGAGTTILTGDNHTFAGTTNVTSGTLMVGELGNENASLGGNVAIAAAGTLRGHGAIGGDVVNDGMLAPGGTIGTLSVHGNYTQNANGALVIEVSPTSASQLKVNGTAMLGGTLRLLYDPGSYSARSYAILTANAINGRFGSVSSVTSTGANLNGLTQSLNYSASEIDLLLAQVAVASPPVTIAPRDTSIYTALGSAAVQGTRAFDRTLLDRFATAPATAPAGLRDGTWAALTTGYARADGNGTASAFGAHRSGFAAGFDHGSGRTLIGGAIGYEHDEIGESATPSTGRLDALRLAAYGSRMLGAIEASGVFGYGFAWATDKRPLGAGPNSTPEGSHWLQSLSGTAQAGIPLEISSDTVLEPRAGLHWAWLHGQGFAESGGGGQNLAVGADTVHSAQPYLGLTLMHAFGTAAEPVNAHVDVEYARELANRTRAVTVVAQDGTAFAAPGAPLAHQIVSLGAGVRAQIGRSWSVSGDASTQLRQGSMLHLQANYRF